MGCHHERLNKCVALQGDGLPSVPNTSAGVGAVDSRWSAAGGSGIGGNVGVISPSRTTASSPNGQLGHRTFNDGLLAMNPEGRPSQPDPKRKSAQANELPENRRSTNCAAASRAHGRTDTALTGGPQEHRVGHHANHSLRRSAYEKRLSNFPFTNWASRSRPSF